jgi:flagellar biosynthetic protein FliQ
MNTSIDLGQAVDLVRHALILALLVSAPMLVIGMVVGIVVSLFQAVTQIQEQTLTFIPKIVSMIAAAIALLPWMSEQLIEYTAHMFLFGDVP